MTLALQLDPGALLKLKEIIEEENNPDLKLRIHVQGGGCSGFQYVFTLDTSKNDDDFVYTFDGVTLVVDNLSQQYLYGAKIVFRDDLMGANFFIENPNAATTCGCGQSFST